MWTSILAFFKGIRTHLSQLLGVAQTELAALEPMFATIATTLSSFFPTGGLALYLANIGTWVADVEKFIMTIDGVIMSPAEAANIGVAVKTQPADKPADAPAPGKMFRAGQELDPSAGVPYVLTGDEKKAYVLHVIKQIYPTLPDFAHNLALEAHVSQLRGVFTPAEALKSLVFVDPDIANRDKPDAPARPDKTPLVK